MFNKETLGRNIKREREKLNITQQQLSEKLYVTFQAVSAWERGVTPPEIDKLCKISEIFGVSVDSLLFADNADGKYMIGIDGGGTKTEFILFNETGQVLRRELLPSSNSNVIGADECCKILANGIDLLRSKTSTITSVFAGIAGGASSGDAPKIEGYLKKRYPDIKFNINGDFINVLGFASDPYNAMGVICGTGAITFLRSNGSVTRYGGWGHLFDDGGSGFNIGRDALRVALAVRDGMCKKNLLAEYIEEKIGNVKENLGSIYKSDVKGIASLSSVVFKAAETGDASALEILHNNTKIISDIIKFAKKESGYSGEIICGGGLFNNQMYYNMVKEKSGSDIILPSLPPVYGACIECCLIDSISTGNDFYEKFKISYSKEINQNA